jgi:serine phosphatase RsbU (regulator of sigma subunit)
MKLKFTIGIKILLLLVFAVGLGLAAYFWIASRLMISDKISYIYDFSYYQNKSASVEYQKNPTEPQLDRVARGFKIRVIEVATQKLLYLSDKNENPLVNLPIQTIVEGTSPMVTSGVRKFDDQIVAYELIDGGKKMVLSYIPEAIAYESVRTLQMRSMYGALCIFLVTLGLAYLLSHGISVRLRSLADATAKVADGEFGVQVKDGLSSQDEVGILGRTFNIMSAKISELLEQRMKQIRMEKELETAELLQSKFFPNERIEAGAYHIEGQSWFASECGGDYWQHSNLEPYLVTIMGDVTGHGASAALVTALIHGVFTSTVRDLKHMQLQDPTKDIITPIINNIHFGLKGSAGENASFTCLLSVIDTRNNKMWVYNAGNPFPHYYRDETQKFESIRNKNSNPLGVIDPIIEPIEMEFKTGDRLYLYTDGLFDVRLSDQAKLNKKKFFGELATQISTDGKPQQSAAIQKTSANAVHEFFGTDRTNRPDDITIVVVERT